jgi:hypothetical protein
MWAELVQAMKDIPTANMGSMRRKGDHIVSLEAGLIAVNTTIASLQQTPTRGLTAAFLGLAAALPVRGRADPVRRNLFPAPNTAVKLALRYRPDQERLQMIRAVPVTIQARTTVGQAAYVQQMAAYTQAHGTGKPSEDRLYPLSPGSRCWVGQMSPVWATRPLLRQVHQLTSLPYFLTSISLPPPSPPPRPRSLFIFPATEQRKYRKYT